MVTHGGQGGRTGPVLRLDLGRLVGVGGLSRWKLGRLNDGFDVFVYICGAGEVGAASGRRELNSEQPGQGGLDLTLFVDGRFPVDVASVICTHATHLGPVSPTFIPQQVETSLTCVRVCVCVCLYLDLVCGSVAGSN